MIVLGLVFYLYARLHVLLSQLTDCKLSVRTGKQGDNDK